jgi:hypothetical protein
MGGTLHCDRSKEELIDYKTRKRGRTRVTHGMQSNYDGSTHRKNKAAKEFFEL